MLFRKKTQEVVVDSRLRHIAFIMDGNGRWAKKRGLPRTVGHSAGAKMFRRVLLYCEKLGLEALTGYAFSTENWKRPAEEIEGLMKLFDQYLDTCLAEMKEHDASFRFIGDRTPLPENLKEKMEKLERETAGGKMRLQIAINYGSRAEICHAVKELIASGEEVTEEALNAHLYTGDCPPPDLIVRTAGEQRLSNYLLWQAAYAEFYFTDTLWPDFDEKCVDEAIAAFYHRKRRFGGL